MTQDTYPHFRTGLRANGEFWIYRVLPDNDTRPEYGPLLTKEETRARAASFALRERTFAKVYETRDAMEFPEIIDYRPKPDPVVNAVEARLGVVERKMRDIEDLDSLNRQVCRDNFQTIFRRLADLEKAQK